MVLSHPRPVVQSVGTQKRPGLGPKWMFIGVKLRNLRRLCPCDVCVRARLCACGDAARAGPSPWPLHPYISLQRGVRFLV